MLRRLFGTKLPEEERQLCLMYLSEEWRLRAIQDDAAAAYNNALTRYGGDLKSSIEGLKAVADAAKAMASVNADLIKQHNAISPIPDVAGECYFNWASAYLRLFEWSSGAATGYDGLLSGTQPEVGRIQQLLKDQDQARTSAEQAEAKLMGIMRVSAEEMRSLMQSADPGPKPVPSTSGGAVIALVDALFYAALNGTGPVNEKWSEFTNERPMSDKSNFVVRSEFIWLMLHAASRTAFALHSARGRDLIQDATVRPVITALIKHSFDPSGAKSGFDTTAWTKKMIQQSIDAFEQDSELSYSECRILAGDDTRLNLSTEVAVGLLADNVVQTTGFDSEALRIVIVDAAADSLRGFPIARLVADAYAELAPG